MHSVILVVFFFHIISNSIVVFTAQLPISSECRHRSIASRSITPSTTFAFKMKLVFYIIDIGASMSFEYAEL